MKNDAIILAGGLGTRLKSVVHDVPKCLALVDNKPFLFYLIQYLQRYDLRKIVFSVGYQKEQVMQFVNLLPKPDHTEYLFAEEEEPLGTGGAILNALPLTETDDVFVLNGDTLFDVNLHNLLEFQQQHSADCSLSLKPMRIADRYGIVVTDENHQITQFKEKQLEASGNINGGVYCLFRHSFMNIPFNKRFSFEKDYLEKMIKERDLYGMIQDHYFIDIGIPMDYEKAQSEIPALFNK